MPRTSRAQNPAVVIIQQFARRLIALYRAATMRNHLLRLDRPPRALRDHRNRAEREEARNARHPDDLPYRLAGPGGTYWSNEMHNGGYGPIREGEWNFVQFRPTGRGLHQEGGFLRAGVDPEAGYEDHQVRFGNPLVYSSWHR